MKHFLLIFSWSSTRISLQRPSTKIFFQRSSIKISMKAYHIDTNGQTSKCPHGHLFLWFSWNTLKNVFLKSLEHIFLTSFVLIVWLGRSFVMIMIRPKLLRYWHQTQNVRLLFVSCRPAFLYENLVQRQFNVVNS